VFLLQQRAPAIPGRQQAFAAELASWAKEAGVGQVLLLAGLDAQYRREQQLEGSQLRYLSSSSSSDGGSAAQLDSAGVQQLEADVVENEKELHGLLPPWPTLRELQGCGVPHTLLSAFAAEGDNTADAMRVAGAALSVLAQQTGVQQQPQSQLQVPCSWAGLVGRRGIDSTLF
jgi:proteasome assembly chaperone 2